MPRNVEYIIVLRDKFTKNLKNANKAVNNMNKSSRALMGTLTALTPMFGGLGAAVALKEGVKVAMDFEKKMSNVKALTGENTNTMAILRKQAEQLGKTTAFSAKQASEGMSFLAMAGFDTKQIMSALPGVLDLAAAGSIDLGKAADIASNVLTQFGIKAENLGRVNDVLAKSASSANVNIDMIAEALKFTGTTSKIVGQSLEETTAAIGLLGNAGLQGSIGGTSLNFALLEMARSSSPAAKKLKKLGVNVRDTQGKFVGITNVIKQFEEKNISAEKALDIFGARGGRAFGALLQAGSKQLMDFTSNLEGARGTAKTMAEIKLDNLAGDITMLKSAAQGFAITLQSEFNDSFRDAVKSVTKLIRSLENNADTIRNLLKIATRALKFWIMYKTTMFALSKAVKVAAIANNIFRFAIIASNRGLKSAIRLTKIFNATMKANVIGLVVTALGFLIAKLVSLRRKTDDATLSNRKLNKSLERTRQLAADIAAVSLKFENLNFLTKEQKEELLRLTEAQLSSAKELQTDALIAIQTSKEYAKLIQLKKELAKAKTPIIAGATTAAIAKQERIVAAFVKSNFGLSGNEITKQIQLLENRIKKLKAAGAGRATLGVDAKLTKKAEALETQITSRSPKVINININKLIETQEISTKTITEGAPQIKRLITETILEALNDTQLSYRAS